jgi:transcription-repair coupling factor (superfamily II helicase)
LVQINIIQHELEGSFMYEDTPDPQLIVTHVKNDMEKRTTYGQVGLWRCWFWKTEVAVRAAFKAVDNGKQVALYNLQQF